MHMRVCETESIYGLPSCLVSKLFPIVTSLSVALDSVYLDSDSVLVGLPTWFSEFCLCFWYAPCLPLS